jgi:hypothetical protein
MPRNEGRLFAAVVAAGIFAAVFAIHYVWLGLFPEQDPLQSQWVAVPSESSWLRTYIETESYWLGYSYGLAGAFASVAFLNYFRSPCSTSKRFALGGATFSGLLAVSACFLVGCCGSPMLVVWLNIFGAAFIPFAKPFIALLTTITIAAAWVWMSRRKPSRQTGIESWLPEQGSREETR